jgi:hypothetical protein
MLMPAFQNTGAICPARATRASSVPYQPLSSRVLGPARALWRGPQRHSLCAAAKPDPVASQFSPGIPPRFCRITENRELFLRHTVATLAIEIRAGAYSAAKELQRSTLHVPPPGGKGSARNDGFSRSGSAVKSSLSEANPPTAERSISRWRGDGARVNSRCRPSATPPWRHGWLQCPGRVPARRNNAWRSPAHFRPASTTPASAPKSGSHRRQPPRPSPR